MASSVTIFSTFRSMTLFYVFVCSFASIKYILYFRFGNNSLLWNQFLSCSSWSNSSSCSSGIVVKLSELFSLSEAALFMMMVGPS